MPKAIILYHGFIAFNQPAGTQKILPQNSSLNNGMKDVPAFLLDPVAVTSQNIKTTIVRDGFHAESEIYQ